MNNDKDPLQQLFFNYGISPVRINLFLQENLKAEQAVLKAIKKIIPEKDYNERLMTMAEVSVLCIILSNISD